jgi:hypothetical protein
LLLFGLIEIDGVGLPFVPTLVHYKVDYIVRDHARIEFIWRFYGQDVNFSHEEAFVNTEIEQLQNVNEVIILTYFWILYINEINIINRAHRYMNKGLVG